MLPKEWRQKMVSPWRVERALRLGLRFDLFSLLGFLPGIMRPLYQNLPSLAKAVNLPAHALRDELGKVERPLYDGGVCSPHNSQEDEITVLIGFLAEDAPDGALGVVPGPEQASTNDLFDVYAPNDTRAYGRAHLPDVRGEARD